MARWVLALVACGACGRIGFDPRSDAAGSASLPPPFQSGTRLRAEVFRTADGVDVFTGYWWDSQLQDFCELYRDSAGVTACRPDQAEIPGNLYADAACTQTAAVFFPQRHCDAPKFAVDDSSGDTYALTMQLATAYTIVNGSCVASPQQSQWLVGAAVPDDQLVTAQQMIAPSGLARASWVMSDGSSEQVGATLDGAQCVVDPDRGQAAPRCATTLVLAPVYADAACTDLWYGATAQPLAVFGIVPADVCSVPTYVTATASMMLATGYSKTASGCSPVGVGEYVMRAGAPVAPDTFPTGAFVEGGSQRVTYRYWQSGDASIAVGAWDQQLATPCVPTYFSDGTWRCAPTSYTRAGDVDSACSTPASFGAACFGVALDVEAGPSDACGRVPVTVTETAPAAIYDNASGTCQQVGSGYVSDGVPLSPSTFASFDRVIQ